jgi:hypothetical protein
MNDDDVTITVAPIPGARNWAQLRHWKLLHHDGGPDAPCADCLAYYGVQE